MRFHKGYCLSEYSYSIVSDEKLKIIKANHQIEFSLPVLHYNYK